LQLLQANSTLQFLVWIQIFLHYHLMINNKFLFFHRRWKRHNTSIPSPKPLGSIKVGTPKSVPFFNNAQLLLLDLPNFPIFLLANERRLISMLKRLQHLDTMCKSYKGSKFFLVRWSIRWDLALRRATGSPA